MSDDFRNSAEERSRFLLDEMTSEATHPAYTTPRHALKCLAPSITEDHRCSLSEEVVEVAREDFVDCRIELVVVFMFLSCRHDKAHTTLDDREMIVF